MNLLVLSADSFRRVLDSTPASSWEWWNLAAQAVMALSPIVLAALSWLSLQAAGLIKAKVSHQRLQGVLLRLDDAVFVATRQIQTAIVEELKRASADGKLTPEERDQVRAATLKAVRSYLGPKGLVEVCSILGLKDDEDERVLGPRVDAATFELNTPKVTNGVH